MPDVDGFKVAGEIRASSQCRRTRIAFHSAISEDWVLQSFDDYDDFLPKPLAGAELSSESAGFVRRFKRLRRRSAGN